MFDPDAEYVFFNWGIVAMHRCFTHSTKLQGDGVSTQLLARKNLQRRHIRRVIAY